MNIPVIISISSIIVWALPPFKQYRTDYFYFFLILAFTSPFNIIIIYLLRISPLLIAVMSSFLLISSLMSYKKQRYFFVILSIISFVISFGFSIHRNTLIILLILTHIIVVLILINSFIKHLQETKAVNLFLILLVTYEFINIVKFIAGLLSFEQGAISYHLPSFIHLFLGITFIFVSLKTKDFPILSQD